MLSIRKIKKSLLSGELHQSMFIIVKRALLEKGLLLSQDTMHSRTRKNCVIYKAEWCNDNWFA